MSICTRNKNNIVCRTSIERLISKAKERIMEAETVITMVFCRTPITSIIGVNSTNKCKPSPNCWKRCMC